MFVPPYGLGEAAVTAVGGLSGAAVTEWNTELEEFRTALITSFLEPVLLHSKPDPGDPALDPDEITTFLMQPLIATQRNRLRR